MRSFWLLLALCCRAGSVDDGYVYEDLRVLREVLQAFQPGAKSEKSYAEICELTEVTCVRVQDRWRVKILDLFTYNAGGILSKAICRLTWLHELHMSKVKGQLPSCLGDLRMLHTLKIVDSRELVGQLPESVSNLKHLEGLTIREVGFTGSFPRAFWSLPRLQSVEIQGTAQLSQMTVDLPEEVGALSQLEMLWLTNVKITSPLPESLGLLPRLRKLYLTNTQLPQPLPSSLGLLRKLKILRLDQNQLEELPPSLAALTELYELDVRSNKIKEFPLSFTALQSLAQWHVGYNPILRAQLHGCTPARRDPCILFKSSKTEAECIDEGMRSRLDDIFKALLDGQYETYRSEQPKCACFWEGVACLTTRNGTRVVHRVVGISLQSERLEGHLPRQLGDLEDLEFLDLRGQLGGAIPEEIGSLQKLKILDLTGNALSGPIPSKIFSMEALQLLSLAENQLSSELASVKIEMPELLVLNISCNRLSGGYATLALSSAQLPKLRYFHLHRNLFQGVLPQDRNDWLGFPNLWELTLSGNQFSLRLPPAIANLNQLRVLDISDTNLVGNVPGAMENMSELIRFDIHNSKIDRKLFGKNQKLGGEGSNCAPMLEDPCHFFATSDRAPLEKALRTVWGPAYWQRHAYSADTPFCSWSGVTCTTSNGQPRVVRLILEDALMSGSVAKDLGDLTALRELRIRSRKTTGALPISLGRLQNLEILEVQGPFDGNLLTCLWLGQLTSLRVLILRTAFRDDNDGDTLPDKFASLEQLEVLDLTGNRVHTDFGDFIRDLPKPKLRELRLSGNILRGALGEELGELTNLEVLALDGNRLDSTLPGGLARLTALRELDLRNNSFEGSIPTDLRKLPHLTRLALGDNNFKRKIAEDNCAPLDEDPCGLFRFKVLPEDGEEPWPFIIAFSLLLSGVFYRDKTFKGGSGVKAGAMELAAGIDELSVYECRRKARNFVAIVEVCQLCLVIAVPLLWRPLLGCISSLTIILGKLLLSLLFHKELILRPLDLLLPEGSSVHSLPSKEMALHATLLSFVATGLWLTSLASAALQKQTVLQNHLQYVFLVAFVWALSRVKLATSKVPFDEQNEQKAKELRQIAIILEVFARDADWRRTEERTVSVDFHLPSHAQRSGEEIELQSSATPSLKSVQSDPTPAEEPEDPEEAMRWDGTGHRKIGVSVSVRQMFAIGGPTSLTMRWTDDRRHSKEVWLLEMGPVVWNGAGGALFDMALVLLMLLQSLALCQFARAEHTFLTICLMATAWRLTIWNALTWIKLPKEIGTTVQQGFFTEGIMRVRSDAFGVVAPVLAVSSCCVAAMSKPDSIAGYFILFAALVPIAITAWQLRIQDRRAGFI